MVDTKSAIPQPPQASIQLGKLQFRINDLMAELNIAMGMMAAENLSLKKQVADLTAKQQQQTPQQASES
jgi:hypothetical protein